MQQFAGELAKVFTMDDIAEALAQFLQKADQLGNGNPPGFADVAFPAGSGTSIGSPIGRELWASDEGQQLIGALLQHPVLTSWAKAPPAPEFTELRRAVATVTDAWSHSNDSPKDFVNSHFAGMMNWLTDPNPVCHGLLIIQGVTTSKPITLLEGLQLLPAEAEHLHSLPDQLPISRKEIFRLPDRPTLLAVCTVQSDRSAWGAFATVTAMGFCRVRLRGLREIIWLATGSHPVLCDEFHWEQSPFSSSSLDHFPAVPEVRYRQVRGFGEILEEDVVDVHLRKWAFFGSPAQPFEESTWLALWMCESYIHAILDQADPLFATLMGYAALDGLLRNPGDDYGVLGPRVAALIGQSDSDRRVIRRFLKELREIRGAAAHGRRPLLVNVARAYGRVLTESDIQANPLGIRGDVYTELEDRLLSILRRSMLAYLWLAVPTAKWDLKSEPPSIQTGLTRQEMLDLADAARRNDGEALARMITLVPSLARSD
jgi:hypothetical protein